jgi:ParB family chromosome partitioning protein
MPPLHLPWLSPGTRIEGCHRFSTLSLCHLFIHPIALAAALHALALKVFYHYGSDSCLELDLKSVSFSAQAPGLSDSAAAEAIRIRHESWAKLLPKDSADLWEALQGWHGDSRAALFAHIVSLSVNAVHEAWNRRPRAFAHADRLAQAVDLDMAAAGWKPTVDNFLGHVTKARIRQAVTEAKGHRAAERIAHLKKGDMAAEAKTLLAYTGWLPEPLRTPGRDTVEGGRAPASESAAEETADQGAETTVEDDEGVDADNDDSTAHIVAAE